MQLYYYYFIIQSPYIVSAASKVPIYTYIVHKTQYIYIHLNTCAMGNGHFNRSQL